MLQLSEILGRDLANTSFPNLYFPAIHDNLVDYLQEMKSNPEFLKTLEEENVNPKEFLEKVSNICTNVERSIHYISQEVNKNVENGKVPYMFNASEVFEMEIDSLITKVKDDVPAHIPTEVYFIV